MAEDPPPPALSVPTLTEGTELVGEFEGSGYRVQPHLVRRFDGQVVRLPELLYLLAKLVHLQQQTASGPRNAQQYLSRLSEALSHETGREFKPDHIVFLIDNKLAPLGVTTYSDGSPPEIPKADPFLSLRFRVAVFSEASSWTISGFFMWLYRPFVMLLAMSVFVFCETLLFSGTRMAGAVQQALVTPTSILLVVLLALTSSAFHEIGHASACRYSGARPGAMGCGIYLVWPAFYTDVTDSYRLGRTGRLRVDLGGVYFNALFVIGLATTYLATGWPVLLVAIMAINLEIVQQLIPSLRFDGYYIISDLVGIPDLFKYIGPILKRTLLRQPADELLQALKRWPQMVVTAWVLVIIPALAVQLGILVVRLPELVETGWTTAERLVETATASGNPVVGVLSAAVQIFFLLLPLAGGVLVLVQLARAFIHFLHRRLVAVGDHEPGRRTPYRRWGGSALLIFSLAGLGTDSSTPAGACRKCAAASRHSRIRFTVCDPLCPAARVRPAFHRRTCFPAYADAPALLSTLFRYVPSDVSTPGDARTPEN